MSLRVSPSVLTLPAVLTSLTLLSAAPADEPLPAKIGKYDVLECLGRGGESTVYLARHPELGTEVVVKWSRERQESRAEAPHRLLREGRVLARLQRADLVRVYDFGVHAGRPFLVMERLKGRSLLEVVCDDGPSPQRFAGLLSQVALALEGVHRSGILHQDIKPGNILIDELGCPHLIDFGMARDLEAPDPPASAPCGGTLAFMAPEQARGQTARIGPETDVFALGATLYFALTRRAPFEGDSLQEVWNRARACSFARHRLVRAEVPPALQHVCLKAMAEDPSRRYPRAGDMGSALKASGSPAAPSS